MRTFIWFRFTSNIYARTLEGTALLESDYEWNIRMRDRKYLMELIHLSKMNLNYNSDNFKANLENSDTKKIDPCIFFGASFMFLEKKDVLQPDRNSKSPEYHSSSVSSMEFAFSYF